MYEKLLEAIFKLVLIVVTFLLGTVIVLGAIALLKLLVNFIW